MAKASQNFDKVMLMKSEMIAFGTPQEVMTPDILGTAYGGGLRVFDGNKETIMIFDEHGTGD